MRLVPVVPVSDPLTVATWLTAIFTGVLAVGAIITSVFAIRAFGKQSQQLLDQEKVNAGLAEVLPLQAEDLRASLAERKRDAAEREREAAERERAAEDLRRAQASCVFLWMERGPDPKAVQPVGWAAATVPRPPHVTTVHVKNTSDQPVYGLEFRWRIGISPLPSPDLVPTLLPGAEESRKRPTHPSANELEFGADVTFRDAAGVKWTRLIDGELRESQP